METQAGSSGVRALSDDEHAALYTLLLRAIGDGVSCPPST
jgi:hypothetical protein